MTPFATLLSKITTLNCIEMDLCLERNPEIITTFSVSTTNTNFLVRYKYPKSPIIIFSACIWCERMPLEPSQYALAFSDRLR